MKYENVIKRLVARRVEGTDSLAVKLGQCANTLLHSNRVLAQLSVDMPLSKIVSTGYHSSSYLQEGGKAVHVYLETEIQISNCYKLCHLLCVGQISDNFCRLLCAGVAALPVCQ